MSTWIDDAIDADSRIFWAGQMSFSSARETDSAGRTAVFKLDLTQAQQKLANPFSVATRRRGKKAGSRFNMTITPVKEPCPLEPFSEEVMLLAWADTPAGSTVTLLLQPHIQLPHPFMHCSKQDKWMGVFVELTDDDQIVDQKAVAASEARPKGQRLSQAAHVLANSLEFQEWCGAGNAAQADKHIKDYCMIKSKSELDNNTESSERFNLLRRKFNGVI